MKRVGALGCLATVVFDAFWLANQGLVAEDYSSSPFDCLGVVLQLNKCCRNLEMNATRCCFLPKQQLQNKSPNSNKTTVEHEWRPHERQHIKLHMFHVQQMISTGPNAPWCWNMLGKFIPAPWSIWDISTTVHWIIIPLDGSCPYYDDHHDSSYPITTILPYLSH